MHKSWGSFPILFRTLVFLQLSLDLSQLVFKPDDMYLWKTNLFVLVLCAIMKSVEGLVYLFESCSLWSWFFLLMALFSNWYLLNHVLIWIFDTIWTTFYIVTLLCAFLGLLGVFSKLCIVWLLKVFACIFTNVYVLACLLSFIQYIG